MALSPEAIRRRKRITLPRAPDRILSTGVQQGAPEFPLPPKGGVLPELTVLTRTFRQPVNPVTAVVLSMRCPLNGRITELNPHFPAGCNALVLLRFGTERHNQCFPDLGFLALEDASPMFRVNISVEYDERLWIEIWNQDLVNVHTPSLSMTIEGR